MGTTIDSVALSSGGFLQARSARRLADAAATSCLKMAGVAPGDIGLLVNAGLYRDRNLGEPAMAALIQEDIGANPEDPYDGGHGTFSFDVANGACGVLTALQVVDGFLEAGTIGQALVVASDANPGFGLAPGFPFLAAGGAAVCSFTEEPVGLAGFRWEVEHGGRELFNVNVSYTRGHNELHVVTEPGFADRAAAAAAKATAGLLADHRLLVDDVDLVIANPLSAEFHRAFAGMLDGAGERMVSVGGAERVHTAGLLVGIDAAVEQGRWATAHRVLLVSAGAGITAGAALLLR